MRGWVAEPQGREGDPSPGEPIPALWTWGRWHPQVSSLVCYQGGDPGRLRARLSHFLGRGLAGIVMRDFIPSPPPPETCSVSPRQHPGFSPAPGLVCVHPSPLPAHYLPCSGVPHVPAGAWLRGGAGMCPVGLFLPSPVLTGLFFGSELPPGKRSCCQGWGWVSRSLQPPGPPCPGSVSS